jgi:hypothetical protein
MPARLVLTGIFNGPETAKATHRVAFFMSVRALLLQCSVSFDADQSSAISHSARASAVIDASTRRNCTKNRVTVGDSL